MIDKIDLDLFKRIIHEGRHNPDLLDSYSINQFRAKERLINPSGSTPASCNIAKN